MKKKRKKRAGRALEYGTHRAVLFALLFASGFSSLVYEVVWARVLTLTMGGSVYAVSVILATFMAGLALGSWALGKISDRIESPLRLMALALLVIGIYGLAFPWLSNLLDDVYLPFVTGMQSRGAVIAVRVLVSAFFLIVPTFLLGGLFPLAVRHLTLDLSKLGRSVGGLYASSTLGGVAGAFFSGIVLIEAYGMENTVAVAAAANVAAALGAFLLSRRPLADEPQETAAHPTMTRAATDMPGGIFLAVIALAGACALAYEVLWTRILTFLVGNITWAFSIMLTVFLAGLGLGSAVISRYVDRTRNLVLFIALVEVAAAVAALALVPAYGQLYVLKRWMVEATGTVNGMVASMILVSFLVMLLPTILLGMAFPAIAKAYSRSIEAVGSGIGMLASLNTLGAGAGSLLVAFFAIPHLGLRNSLILTAAVNALAGVVLLLFSTSARSSFKLAFALVPPLLFAAGYMILPENIEARGPVVGYERIFRHETTGGIVEIFELKQEDAKTLLLNGVPEVATDRISMQTLRLLALLPVLVHPEPKDALLVTFGSGIVAGTMGRCNLDRIDCVEIFPGIREAVSYFGAENHAVLENPLVDLYTEDGRNFLLTARSDYDIITTDATHPTGAESWLLYTREYYELCRERLAPDGIFVQWIPLHQLTFDAYCTILHTIRSQFPYMEVWFSGVNASFGHTIVLASQREFRIDYDLFRERLATPFISEDLKAYGLDDPLDLLSLRLMDEKGVDKMVEGTPLNTDDRPLVSFPTTLPQENDNIENLSRLIQFRTAPRFSALPKEEGPRVRDMLAALPDRFLGEVLYYSGKPDKALAAFHRALSKNPRDTRAFELLSRIELRRAKDKGLPQPVRPTEPDAERLFAKGYLAFSKENYSEAKTLFLETIEKGPTFPEPYCYLGITLAKLGERDEARKHLEKALEMEPEMGLARRGLLELAGKL